MQTKAISAIIGIILMLIITIALIGVAFSFISGVFTSKTASSFSILDSFQGVVTISNTGETSIQEITANLDGGTTQIAILPDIPNLVAYWSFNDNSGATAVDSSRSGNDGTLTNMEAEDWVDGKFGKALDFDGSNEHVAVEDTPDINDGVHDKRTITAWFNVNDKTVNTRKQVVYEEGAGFKGLNFYIFDGQLYVGGWNNPAGESNWAGTYLATDQIESNKWHHVALVLDGTPSLQPNAIKAYLDGNLFGSGDGSQLWDHKGDIGIGMAKDGTQFHDVDFSGDGHGFDGIIDEVAVFNQALDENEVKQLASGLVGPGQLARIKPLTSLSQGTYQLRLCTASMCSTAVLTIT